MSWSPGDQITWHYRRPRWTPGQPEFVTPMTVVRDDDRGLVAWLAPGTEMLTAVLADGSDLRSAPLGERFGRPRAAARTRWRGPGILRAAPPRTPWSVWLFWEEDGAFAGWYLNLETPRRREGTRVLSADHVLDVWVEPDGTVELKDEDELRMAVEGGLFTAAEGAQIRADGDAAIASYRAREFPFDEPWPDWRPDPAWARPSLPDDVRWDFDRTEPG